MNPVGGRTRRAHNGRGKSLVAIAATMAVVASMAFTGVSLADDDPAGTSTEAAATTPALDDLAVAVTSDPATGASVEAGATVSVTLALSNSSPFDLPAGTHVTSDVKDVLPAVELPADLAAAGLTLEGDVLTWTVPEVISSDSATTTFDLVAKAPVAAPVTIAAAVEGAEPCAVETCATSFNVTEAESTETTPTETPAEPTEGAETTEATEPTDGTETTDGTESSGSTDPSTSGEETSELPDPSEESPAESTGESPDPTTEEPAEPDTDKTTESAEPTPTSSMSTSTSAEGPRKAAVQPEAEADADGPVIQAVPPATGNNAVITVKVGGNRLTTAAVGPLAGVTLTSCSTATQTARPTPATGLGTRTPASPTSTATAPGSSRNTQAGPPRAPTATASSGSCRPACRRLAAELLADHRPGRWPVRRHAVPVPHRHLPGERHRLLLRRLVHARHRQHNVPTASGGIWQNSKVNPVAPTKCGLNVALVLDVSGSVSGSLPALKTAATTFTNALVGTPSNLALFTFAANAPANTTNNQNRPLTAVSTQAGANQVNTWINGLTAGGTTNWDRGIFQVQQSTAQFDIAVVITDGNPTVYGNAEGPGNYTRFREVENGIFSANAVKAENTRMLAFGVGAGIAAGGANLAAISGPTLNSDYFQTGNFGQVGDILRNLALGSCTGSVTVIKQVVPNTAPPGSITGATPAGGWTFGATTTASGVTIAPASGATADGTGALNFNLTFPGGTTTAPVAVTETQQTGHTLVQVGGFNAVCTRPGVLATDPPIPVPVTNTGALGFTVPANIAYGVTCSVYNRAPNPPAEIVVNKQWSITDTTSGTTTTFANGTQPSDLQAALTLGGTAQPFGVARTGFAQGSTVVIAETVTNGLRGCVLGTPTISRTQPPPPPTNVGLPYTATLAAGTNSFMITNPVTCTTRLTLVKSVTAGPAAPTAWNLSATAPAGAAAGPTGTTGVSALVTPGARYTLAEAGGDPRYIQRAGANAVPIPGSTVSWQCVEIDANGNVVPGFADGLNGGVIVFVGLSVRCTAVNDTARLILIKNVINNNGGDAEPDDFFLTATPTAPVFPGLTATTQPGSTTGATIWVRPGQTYTISETGPPGYTNSDLFCVNEDGVLTRELQLSVPVNTTTTCTFVNDDEPGLLTLVKVVDNGDTGATADAGDWTLSAAGPTPVSGTGDSPTIVDQTVNAGNYALSESAGPAGYTPSAWSCTGGTLTGSSVAVPIGGDVTCTITNTAKQPTLRLIKEVDNGNTGGTATPTDWDVAADGPTAIDPVPATPASSTSRSATTRSPSPAAPTATPRERGAATTAPRRRSPVGRDRRAGRRLGVHHHQHGAAGHPAVDQGGRQRHLRPDRHRRRLEPVRDRADARPADRGWHRGAAGLAGHLRPDRGPGGHGRCLRLRGRGLELRQRGWNPGRRSLGDGRPRRRLGLHHRQHRIEPGDDREERAVRGAGHRHR